MPDKSFHSFMEEFPTTDAWLEGLERLGVFVARSEGRIVEGEAVRGLGIDASRHVELEGRVHPEDLEAFSSLRRAAEAPGIAEYRVSDAQGQWRWLRSRFVSVEAGNGAFVLGIEEDVTERRRVEDRARMELEEAERRFDVAESMRAAELVASASPDLGSTIAAVLKQARLSIPFASASVFARSGAALARIGGYSESGRDPAEDLGEISARLEEAIAARSPIILQEGGRSRIGVPLIFKGKALGGLEFDLPADGERERDYAWPAMIFGDMLAIKLDGEVRRKELVLQASTDPLTALLTRRSFSDIAAKQLSRLAESGEPIAVILADIDHFKSFNDRYGHLRGDEVLRGAADCLREGLRQEDVICRFGGEEIVALLPGASRAIALEVAERLRAKLEGLSFPGIEECVTASFGVAVCADSALADLDLLVERADRAMYLAKERGRNRVVLEP
jgi:diguanylate cyclase (GGDEF)-like protein